LKLCQLSFACFHFFLTWLSLSILSRLPFAFFVPRQVSFRQRIPLAVAMCFNVILPNLSLAFSSVVFYQLAWILLTPIVAVMNFVLYRATLPRNAIIALVPACLGVGIVSYTDSLPLVGVNTETTSPLGMFFTFTGVLASSLYTVWIGRYHTKLQMNSMQLLHNQAPIASLLLIYAIPYLDTFPEWAAVPLSSWLMILLVCPFSFHRTLP
jgi:solute carrier family 35 protein E3